jgi:hypothetical protein
LITHSSFAACDSQPPHIQKSSDLCEINAKSSWENEFLKRTTANAVVSYCI